MKRPRDLDAARSSKANQAETRFIMLLRTDDRGPWVSERNSFIPIRKMIKYCVDSGKS